MAKGSPIITSFNSGEFSPLMAGRVDFKYYPSACKRLLNFIPVVQGPVTRRTGTILAGEVKDSSDRTWLGRFVFNRDQSYILEFGDLYIRFYSSHGIVGGGTPVEVVTPYSASDLINQDGSFALRFVQSGDVLYIVGGGHPPYKLTRTGASSFTFGLLNFKNGPFNDVDPDNTVTVYASAATGTVTLTASSSIFTADHVGSLFLLEQKAVDDNKQWEVGKSVSIGNIRRSDGKNYKALNASTTGSVRPVHTFGAKYDGDAGVQWQFNDPGYGILKITAYTSGTQVTATVESGTLPDGCVTSGKASTRWAFSSFSDVEGWPDYVTFFRERLVFSKNRKLFFSVSGDFENFSKYDDGGLITADMAIIIDITSEEANDIVWMAPQKNALLVGTTGEELAVLENNTSNAFGPGNIKSERQSKYGSAPVTPMIVGDGVLYAQRSGKKLRDMVPAESVDQRWRSIDVSILANHIPKQGVIGMAYQQEPHQVVWCVLSNGSLAGFTVDRDQDVRAWHPHKINDAVVECAEVVPSPDGDYDEVWVIVKRIIDGSSKRYLEYMAQEPDHQLRHHQGDIYLDSSLILDNHGDGDLTPGTGADIDGSTSVEFVSSASDFVVGDVGRFIHYNYAVEDEYGVVSWGYSVAEITAYNSATSVDATIIIPFPSLDPINSSDWRLTVLSVSGLDHLEGETVSVLADGSPHPDVVVDSGSVDLEFPASYVVVGKNFMSTITPVPIEYAASDGTAQGKTKRIPRCVIRFFDTIGAKYGRSLDSLDSLPSRSADDHMGVPPPLFTGDAVVSWPDGYSDDAVITIAQDLPLPCTIVAIMPQLQVFDQR